MNTNEWQAEEDKYLVTIDQLTEQENWARANGFLMLAKAYSAGSSMLVNELGVLQKLRAKDKEPDELMQDFCGLVIKLKSEGFFVEDMGSEHGPQFDGQYRWMNSKTLDFQDSAVSETEVEAWVACINYNIKL